ncbi:DUF397 domain-containing protein [Streptomyces sp. NPDC016845]|uniref:DUF397 domain-containing protein n=1 Tax=Streptomyces sp. NPDC016845 TaxID=3364972 RepID=UPI0037ADCCEC
MSAAELAWRKSSYSSNSNEPDCVEVAHAPGAIHIRDSKNAPGPRLRVARSTWASFIGGVSSRTP